MKANKHCVWFIKSSSIRILKTAEDSVINFISADKRSRIISH